MKSSIRLLLSAMFICCFGISSSFGKGYIVLNHSASVNVFDSTPDNLVQVRVINDSTGPVTIKWAIISDGYPGTGWSYSFCDLNQCFVSSYPQYNTDLLLSKDTAAFSMTIIHFNNKAVSATISIALWDAKDIHKVDTITIAINATRMGIENNVLPSSFVDVFPNPATNSINLKTSQPGFEPIKAFIFNTLGKSVSEQSISGGTTTLPLNDLPKGIYIISLRDQYGKEAIKQFVKE